MKSRQVVCLVALLVVSTSPLALLGSVAAAPPRQSAGTVLEVTIPEAVGGKVVLGNLAVDEIGGGGFVTAYPCDQPRPLKSDLNAPLAGPPQSNRFIGAADANGRICFASNRPTSIIFDANAVLANVATFPNRRTDTRGGTTIQPNGVLEVLVPEAVGGKVVVGNLAVDEQAAPGFVTGWPCGQPKPLAADLNFYSSGATSNRFVGQASADGRICFSPNVRTHLIFDASATLPDAVPFTPRRFDTRESRRVTPDEPLDIFIPEGVGGKTVIGNLAIDRPERTGFVTAYPCSEGRPFASDLNFVYRFDLAAQSNRFVGRADATGHICFYSNTSTDIIVDANATLSGVTPFANRRTDTRVGPWTPFCTTSQLTAQARRPSVAPNPLGQMDVLITNTGAACELGGYPTITGVTAAGQTKQLQIGPATFASPYVFATITQGETFIGFISNGFIGSRCPFNQPAPGGSTWSSFRLQFAGGAMVEVPALLDPTCYLAVTQFGTHESLR